jgi:hypothetical protein
LTLYGQAAYQATDAEHNAAHAKAQQVMGYLSLLYGFCEPMYNDSGNGAHILYPINEPNTEEVRDAIHKFLKCLSAKFSNAASRWTRLYLMRRAFGVYREHGAVKATVYRNGHIGRRRYFNMYTILTGLRLLAFHAFIAAHEVLLADKDKPSGLLATKSAGEYPQDERKYKLLNDHAMRRIPEWVPVFFPDASPYKEGYRIAVMI